MERIADEAVAYLLDAAAAVEALESRFPSTPESELGAPVPIDVQAEAYAPTRAREANQRLPLDTNLETINEPE
jgi:hypothetical protein